MKKRAISLFLLCSFVVGCLCGCMADNGLDLNEVPSAIASAVNSATSVEASVSIAIQARVGTSSDSAGHNASLGADITATSTSNPFTYHGEYYSNIIVDGLSTREDKEYYVVLDDNDVYSRYEYSEDTEEWLKNTMTHSEVMALPLKSCVIQDWNDFLKGMDMQSSTVSISNREAYLFEGEAPGSYIQELVGEKVFGSFLYSVEQLLDDMVPCVAYFDAETLLPIQIEMDFTDSFIVNDMTIDNAVIVAEYSDWGHMTEIELPKKISIVATDETARFYSTYYAWNLFLPYINTSSNTGGTAGNSGLSFTTSWETYQMRIDSGMTSLPITYESLHNLGYDIDSSYSSNILEPYTATYNVPVMKGRDQILCTFYNPDTAPRPIADCFIGCIDVRASGIVNNGISIFLPGEITLGVTREALVSAYGEPDEKITSFAADTYIWHGAGETQSFTAELSPVTGQVIRLCLKNMPVLKAPVPETQPPTPETQPPAPAPEADPGATPPA